METTTEATTATTNTITPGPINGTCQLADLTGAELLAKRHRGNTNGTWTLMASREERGGDNYHVIARLSDGAWVRVLYYQASGRIKGTKDKAPRKTEGYIGNTNKTKKAR